jgi:hypothetical protein
MELRGTSFLTRNQNTVRTILVIVLVSLVLQSNRPVDSAVVSAGDVKSSRSASTVGASGNHDGKVTVLQQPVSRVLRRQAPRAGLRPGRHLARIFRRDFGERPGRNGLARWSCRGRRVRAKRQWIQPAICSGA